MRSDKNQAMKLRLRGRSYSEINRLLGVPKATLSDWFAKLELSDDAKKRLAERAYQKSMAAILRINRLQTIKAENRARIVRLEAKSQISTTSQKELLLVGTALYWAEGYKRPIMRNGKARVSHPVSFTNSDPRLVRLFLKFLREVCSVPEEKLTASVRIYQHQNEGFLMNFWSQTTSIPFNKFGKTYYGVSKSSQGKRPFNILPYGTIQIRVSNTALYHRIMGWIEGLANI
ncbi:MAG: hypothetical protein AAB585_01875 [Patescibacteria group bacterium]